MQLPLEFTLSLVCTYYKALKKVLFWYHCQHSGIVLAPRRVWKPCLSPFSKLTQMLISQTVGGYVAAHR